MPIESIIVSALVVAVFSTFGIALAYAERQTATSRADRNALAGLLNPSSTGRKRRSANPHRSPPRCPRQPNCDEGEQHG